MSDKSIRDERTPLQKEKRSSFTLRLFSKCINGLWAVLAFSVILLAIVIAGLRLFTEDFSTFKPDLESYLSQQLGRKVHIQEMKFEWPSVGPRLQIKQLEIEVSDNAKLNALVIANGVIAVDLWRSFFSMELITDEINLQGIQILYNPTYRKAKKRSGKNFYSEDKKALSITNKVTSPNKNKGSSDRIVKWLLKQRTIEIYDSFLLLKTNTDKSFSLALPVFTFHGGSKRHQLSGTAVTTNGKQLIIKSELKGGNNDPERKLQLYVKADDIDLKDLPTSLIFKKYTKIEGSLAVEIWADFKASHMQKMLIKASANKLFAGAKKLSFSIPENFFLWKRSKNHGWDFTSTPIEIMLNNKKLPAFVLEGKRLEKNENKEKIWDIQGLTLPVKLVSGILQDQLPDKLKNWLGRAKPTGLLSNIGTTMKFNNKNTRFDLHFDLSNFSIKQIDQFPGMKNINGHIRVTENKAIFSVDSKHGSLNLAPLFRFPLPFDRLSTTLSYEYGDNSKLLWDNFKFESKNVDIYSLGKIEYFNNGNGYMEISTQLQNGNTKFTPHFLPVGVMSKNTVRYLDNSIRSGKLVKANAIVRGSLNKYPYINNDDGVFDVQAKIENIDFKFLANWPALKKLNANLRFHANSMDILATHGIIDGIIIEKTSAEISDLSKNNNNLLLDIHAKTNGMNAMDFLSKTSLNNIAEQLDFLAFKELDSKKSKTDLFTNFFIDIPLNGNKPPNVEGSIEFVNSDLFIKAPYIPFEGLNGKLKISDKGLISGKLEGQLWQQPFNLKLKRQNTPLDILTGEFKSNISTTGINQLTGLNFDDYISGKSVIKGNLKIYSAQNNKPLNTVIDIHSSLENIDIHFPDKLIKKPQDKMPFNFSIQFSKDTTSIKSTIANSISFSSKKLQTLKTQYPDLWHSNLIVNLTDHKTNSKINPQVNFNANISLPTLTIDNWLPLYKQFNVKTGPADVNSSFPTANVKLNADSLLIFGFDLGSTSFNITKDKDLDISFTGEKTEGNIFFNNQSEKTIQVNFKKLHLISQTNSETALSPDNNQTNKQQNKTDQLVKSWTAADFPALKIHCDSCQYNKQLLGTIDLESIPSKKSLQKWVALKGSWFYNKLFLAKFSGLWQDNMTKIQGDLLSDNFDKLTEFWNLSSGVKKSKLTGSFIFQWPDAPWDFNIAQLDGKISTALSSGYLDEISTKGAQVFSLFSLQNLKRRLTLDFNDVFEKGFFYDDISGTFLLKKGIAYSQDLKINGTAAGISITGSTNLVSGEYNQHMVVTPKLSSSIPVLAGWAISPPTALLALVFDKLFLKPALDVVSRIDYQIIGSWDDPKLIELGKKQKEVKIEEK